MGQDHYTLQRLKAECSGVYTTKRAAVIGVCSILGFVLVVNSSWIASPDSALYLELGESLARGTGYAFNGEPHTYVPPGYPFMIAAVVKAFGSSFLVYRLLMSALGALAAALGFVLVARLFGRDVGLLAGGAFAVNHALLENSTLATSDVPFAVVVLAGLNALLGARSGEKAAGAWLVAAAVILGLAPMMRVNGWGVLPAAAFYLAVCGVGERWTSRSCRVGFFLAISLLPAVAWHFWTASQPVSATEGTYINAVSGRSIYDQLRVMTDALVNYVPEMSYALTGVSIKGALAGVRSTGPGGSGPDSGAQGWGASAGAAYDNSIRRAVAIVRGGAGT